MPTQNPRFRPPGWRERQPWERPLLHRDQRKRGRAGQRDRRQVLREEPFCRRCLEDGKHVASDVVDHIVPLAEGGSDDRENKQGLCDPCHDAKTRDEARRGRSRSGSPRET
ncbi:MAG: endonuclease [Novosphingobium pentaromativorans]|uniref:Endonuclease n=1 Tax=Novosphingobium pentaromativorans TaxID=205844 RepID=A0A2W5NWE6_9SPHN|nr:MAG: endonuclease [Novosphingobium pentaromativorans]